MLGAAATFINGKAYKQEELLDKGKYKVLRVGNFFTNMDWYFSDLELDEDKYCDSGDLLYAWSASFGPRIWTDGKVIYHYHIWKVIEAKGICKQFLFVLLDNETERIKVKSSNGLGLLHITKGAIEGWGCCIPNFGEQQKIADFLTSLDEIITLEIQKLDTLKTYKKGLLQQLFPEEGETLPKLRFPEFRDSLEWEEKLLNSLLDYQQPTDYLVSDTNYSNSYKTPVLTAGKTFILGYTNETHGIFNKNLPVIIFDDFTTAMQFVEFPFKAKSSAMKILQAKNDVSIKFMYEALQMVSYEVGVHERHWISKFAPMPVLIPKLAEQQKIADCLSSIDDVITLGEQKINALKTHKKGLMQQLFPTLNEEQP